MTTTDDGRVLARGADDAPRPSPATRAWRSVRDDRGPWVALLAGVVAGVVGWRLGVTGLYLGGLVVTALALAVVVGSKDRARVGLLAAAAVVAGGIAGPWLGIRLAYAGAGVEVSGVESYAEYVGHLGDVAVLAQSSQLVGLGGDGDAVWVADEPDRRLVWTVGEDRVLVRTGEELRARDAQGAEVWSVPWTKNRFRPVAVADGVLVVESCDHVSLAEGMCSWTGLRVADGRTAWETSAPAGGARWVASFDDLASSAPGLPPTSIVATGTEAGGVALLDGATGRTLGELAPGREVVLVGDAALLVTTEGDCSVELVRDGATAWTTPFDCELWRPSEHLTFPAGTLVGSTFWFESWDDGAGRLVVDLEDGAVRTEAYAFTSGTFPYGDFGPDDLPVNVLADGVVLEVTAGAVIGRTPEGEERWRVGIRSQDLRSLQASADVVVLSRYPQPLLLHEWFAREDRSRVVVDVLDARTGALLAGVRQEAYPWSPTIVGDRVLMEVDGANERGGLRLVGG
ncbi:MULTISPECIES: hypothetical protein [unclassified Actinotalea]|uniref:hypothetical protein n=1 Tax=unclassified Actinotalea TaxID=2638618 RepID=UPI0015F3CF81|nr:MULTISPECIES: hypothetical protein [unclassified Actinotalea]